MGRGLSTKSIFYNFFVENGIKLAVNDDIFLKLWVVEFFFQNYGSGSSSLG